MEPQFPMLGRLVADPTQQVTANGTKVTRFRVACSGRRFDKAANDWVSTDPVYMSVVCWRHLGDNVMQSLSKGDAVVVVGRLTYREWDDPTGGRQHRYEMHATAVGPDLSRYVTTLSRPLRELPDIPGPAQVPPQVVVAAADDVAAA
jgi:single-strand DNA-binding protein